MKGKELTPGHTDNLEFGMPLESRVGRLGIPERAGLFRTSRRPCRRELGIQMSNWYVGRNGGDVRRTALWAGAGQRRISQEARVGVATHFLADGEVVDLTIGNSGQVERGRPLAGEGVSFDHVSACEGRFFRVERGLLGVRDDKDVGEGEWER